MIYTRCIHPGALRSRGSCRKCNKFFVAEVLAGRTTWAELEATDVVDPVGARKRHHARLLNVKLPASRGLSHKVERK